MRRARIANRIREALRRRRLYERIEQETLTVERQTIIRLRDEYIIGDEVLRRIQRDLDLAEARLREKHRE